MVVFQEFVLKDEKMAHCQWCGGDILSSAGGVEHCEFVMEPEQFAREQDGFVIGCDEEALNRIRKGELPWGLEEEDRSGHGVSKFPRFKVLVTYQYDSEGNVTNFSEEPFEVSDEDLDHRADVVRETYELEAKIDAAVAAVDSLPKHSEDWKKAKAFLKEVEQQDKLEQQEEACNRWL